MTPRRRRFKARTRRCNICNRDCANYSELSIHINKFHAGDEKTFKCRTCGYVMISYNALQTHKFYHRLRLKALQNGIPVGRSFTCKICGEEFLTFISLGAHINKQHDGANGTFKCHICGHVTLSPGSLSRHFIHYHLNEDDKDPDGIVIAESLEKLASFQFDSSGSFDIDEISIERQAELIDDDVSSTNIEEHLENNSSSIYTSQKYNDAVNDTIQLNLPVHNSQVLPTVISVIPQDTFHPLHAATAMVRESTPSTQPTSPLLIRSSANIPHNLQNEPNNSTGTINNAFQTCSTAPSLVPTLQQNSAVFSNHDLQSEPVCTDITINTDQIPSSSESTSSLQHSSEEFNPHYSDITSLQQNSAVFPNHDLQSEIVCTDTTMNTDQIPSSSESTSSLQHSSEEFNPHYSDIINLQQNAEVFFNHDSQSETVCTDTTMNTDQIPSSPESTLSLQQYSSEEFNPHYSDIINLQQNAAVFSNHDSQSEPVCADTAMNTDQIPSSPESTSSSLQQYSSEEFNPHYSDITNSGPVASSSQSVSCVNLEFSTHLQNQPIYSVAPISSDLVPSPSQVTTGTLQQYSLEFPHSTQNKHTYTVTPINNGPVSLSTPPIQASQHNTAIHPIATLQPYSAEFFHQSENGSTCTVVPISPIQGLPSSTSIPVSSQQLFHHLQTDLPDHAAIVNNFGQILLDPNTISVQVALPDRSPAPTEILLSNGVTSVPPQYSNSPYVVQNGSFVMSPTNNDGQLSIIANTSVPSEFSNLPQSLAIGAFQGNFEIDRRSSSDVALISPQSMNEPILLRSGSFITVPSAEQIPSSNQPAHLREMALKV